MHFFASYKKTYSNEFWFLLAVGQRQSPSNSLSYGAGKRPVKISQDFIGNPVDLKRHWFQNSKNVNIHFKRSVLNSSDGNRS